MTQNNFSKKEAESKLTDRKNLAYRDLTSFRY